MHRGDPHTEETAVLMRADRQLALQFLRYLGVGGTTALVYFALIFLTLQILQFQHFLAITISYLCAISLHFVANKTFTFRSRERRVGFEVLRYSLVTLLNYLITLAVVFLVVDWGGQSTYLGALLAIAVTLGLGYCFTKCWVFNERGSQ
jgi:putative flippase GtrA